MSTASGDSARGDGSSQVHHRRKSHTPSFEQIEEFQIHGRSHLQSHAKKSDDSADDDDDIASESIFTKIKTHSATIVVIFLLLVISLGCSLNVNAALWLSALQTTGIALCALRWEHDQWMAKVKGNFPANICPLICQFFMFSIPAMLAGLLVFVAGTSPFREVAAAMLRVHAPCFRCQVFSPAFAQLKAGTFKNFLEVLQDIQQSDADSQLVVSRSKLSIASVSLGAMLASALVSCRIDTLLVDKFLLCNLSASSAERRCGQLCTRQGMALLQERRRFVRRLQHVRVPPGLQRTRLQRQMRLKVTSHQKCQLHDIRPEMTTL